MEKKVCFKCNIEKPLSEFYKHDRMGDGHLNKCKECAKKDVAENYQNNREYYAKYEQERSQRPERKKKTLEYQRTRRAKDPNKYKAYGKTNYAMRGKRLLPEPCETCESEINIEAHHEDYNKPLDVKWLCRSCHLSIHNKKAYCFDE